MDFHSMKRKELQALCKKHKIPANVSNLEMANKLEEIYKEKENSLIKGLIKEQTENASETETINVVMHRKVKKVRFSPEHELIEFTRSRGLKRRCRRISVSSRDSSLSVDSGEMNNGIVGGPGRVTRSGGWNQMESEVNVIKRVRKGVKCHGQKNNIAVIENSGELMEDDVDKTCPVKQLRGKILVEGVKNASKRGRKSAKDDDKTDEKALDNANNKKLIEEIVDVPARLTRSRGKKLMEASTGNDKEREVVENNDNVALVGAETDENRAVSGMSLRTRGVAGKGKLPGGLGERVKSNRKGWKEEVLENTTVEGVNVIVEPQILLRRSKRNMNRVGDSKILNDDTRKHENGGIRGMRNAPKLLGAEGSGVDAESTRSKVYLDGGIALQIEAPIKQRLQRNNRRKKVIVSPENLENDELKEETESRCPLTSSVPQPGTAGGVSKDDKKLLRPTGVIRRSRRKTSSLELVFADETIKTGAAVENFETENHLSKPCPIQKESPAVRKNPRRSRRNASKNNSIEILDEICVNSIIQEKNEGRKRKRGSILRGETKNDSNSPTESMRKESRSEKPVPAATTGKIADIREPPSRLKEPNMMDASSHNDLWEIGKSFVDAQFSISEGTESINNMGLSSDANVENIISDVGLPSSREIHRKEEDISIADGARNADTRSSNGNELANSDENAVPRIAELKMAYTDTQKQISASKLRGDEKVRSLLEFDVKELIEENISGTDKNDTAAQMFSQTEDSSCDNLADHQVLLESSTVSGNACFAETSYSSDSLLLGDQPDFKSDLEAPDAEVDKQAQPSLDAVDGEIECVSLQGNLESVETGCTNAVSMPSACHHDDLDHLESSDSISGRNNEDTSIKAGENGAIETCEGHVESTDLKSALQLEEPSSSKRTRSLEGYNTAEGDEIYSHKLIDIEVAENDDGGCLSIRETASHEDSDNVPVLYGERSAGIIPQDGGHAVINSDQNNYEDTSPNTRVVGALESYDRHIESTALKSTLQLKEPSSSKLRRSLKGDNTAEGDEIYTHNSIDSEVADDDKGRCLRDHGTARKEDSKSNVPEIYGERSAWTIPQDGGHTVINSDENNKEDASPKAREVGAFESCDGHTESTDLKNDLHLEEPSSGKARRSLKGDNAAEGDEIYSQKAKGIGSEVPQNDDGQCLRDHETAGNEDSEFIVPELFGVRSARIIPQDRGHAIMNSNEHEIYNNSLAARPITISANTSDIKRGHGAHDTAKKDETYNNGVHAEFSETDGAGSSRHQKSKCHEDAQYSVSNLFGAEKSARIMPRDKEIFSGEDSIKDFDEQEMFHDSPSEPPTTLCNCADIKLTRYHEAGQIAGGETYVYYKDIQSELAEADKGGCLKDQTSTEDEDWLTGISNLFDAERSSPVMPQGCSCLQEISPFKPNSVSEFRGAVSTISNTCEIIGKEAGAADTIQEREFTIVQSEIPGDEVSAEKTISDGEQEIFHQADEHTNKDTYESVEQPKSPLADSIQGQEAWSNANEITRPVMPMFKINGKGKSSQGAKGSTTDEDASHANCGKDEEDLADASITDASISVDYTTSKRGMESLNELKFQGIKQTEHECKSPLSTHTVSYDGEESSDVSSQSWTEFELNNLFGTTLDSVTPTRRNDTSCQGTEIATLTMSMNNSITISCSSASSLTKKKKEMEVERGSEHAKTTDKNVALPTNYEEAADIGSSLGSEENHIKLLFATPIKILSPCKVDETSAHEGKLVNAATHEEYVGMLKENVATQIEFSEKVGDSGNEFENSLCIGNSLQHNAEELSQVEGVELVNNCTTPVLSVGECGGCEASKEQLTDKACECTRETYIISEEREEEEIISVGQSCHYEEATDNHSEGMEKDIISLCGVLKNVDKVEGCSDMLIDADFSANLSCGNRYCVKSEGELAQSTEVAVNLSDANFQKSRIPENGRCGYVDSNILSETSIENFSSPMDREVASIDHFDGGKYGIDKGTSSSFSPKASYDDGEVTERKDAKSIRDDDGDPCYDISDTWVETFDNLRSSRDISDELHANSDVAILEKLSVGFTLSQEAHKLPSILEPQRVYKEIPTGTTTQNADNIVPTADHGSSVRCAEFDILNSMAMHRLLGDKENGGIEKSEARTPLFNSEDDVEKNDKEVKENSTEAIVQFSISKLHLEENFVDSNRDINIISDASKSQCNEILKESDVAYTIKEYIDSESSLCMDFEGSGASLKIDVFAHIGERSTLENAALRESKEAVDDNPAVESLEIECKELEESTLFMRPDPGSEDTVKSSPACVDLLVEGSTAYKPSIETKGFTVNNAFLTPTEMETSSKQLHPTPKKTRTIFIHGTPRKLLPTADMKENAPLHKNLNIGDFTTVRPAKRRALQDVQWQ